jgi:hypothetical protein
MSFENSNKFDPIFHKHQSPLGTRTGRMLHFAGETENNTKQIAEHNKSLASSMQALSQNNQVQLHNNGQSLGNIQGSLHQNNQLLDKGIDSLSHSLENFQEQSNAWSEQLSNQYEAQYLQNEELQESIWENIEQGKKNTQNLQGVSIENIPIENIENNNPLLHLLAQEGYLSHDSTKKLEEIKPYAKKMIHLAESFQNSEINIRRNEEDENSKNTKRSQSLIQDHESLLSRIEDLPAKEKDFFWKVYSNNSTLDESTLQVLAQNQILSPLMHKKIMKARPEMREGITGINLWLEDTNNTLQSGFSSTISHLDNIESGIKEVSNTITHEEEKSRKNMQYVGKNISSTIKNESQQSRNVMKEVGTQISQMLLQTGVILHDDLESVEHAIQNNTSMICSVLDQQGNNNHLDAINIQNTIINSNNNIVNEIRNNTDLTQKNLDKIQIAIQRSAQYVSYNIVQSLNQNTEVTKEGMQILHKDMQWIQYISTLQLKEAVYTNQNLQNINHGLSMLHENILEGRKEIAEQSMLLLQTLYQYENNQSLRHQEQYSLLSYIHESIQDMISTMDTRDKKSEEDYNIALKFLQAREIHDAISILKKIIKRNPKHYESRIALVEAYIMKNNIKKALIYAKKALIISQDMPDDIREISEMTYAGLSFQLASELKKEKRGKSYSEIVLFLEQTDDPKNFSHSKYMNYLGCIYASGNERKAIKKLEIIIYKNPNIILELENIEQFKKFFQGYHLFFFKKILKRKMCLSGKVCFYMFLSFLESKDFQSAKTILEKGITNDSVFFMQNKIYELPLEQAFIHKIINNLLLKIYTQKQSRMNSIALYYMAKKMQCIKVISILFQNTTEMIHKEVYKFNSNELKQIQRFLDNDDFKHFIHTFQNYII